MLMEWNNLALTSMTNTSYTYDWTGSMHGDNVNGFTMFSSKPEDGHFNSDLQYHRIKPQEHFIEAQVQEDDTLQAIALRFYCSISELKRINQIHKENEIYARRIIKVPVSPYSVLTELMPAQSLQPVPSTSKYTPGLIVHNPLRNPVHNISTHEHNISGEKMEHIDCAIYCNTVIPYTDSNVTEAVSEDTKLLPERTKVSGEAVKEKERKGKKKEEEVTLYGADFVLKWFYLVCIVFILGCCVRLLLFII